MHGGIYGQPVLLPNGKVMMSINKIRAKRPIPRLFENWETEVFFVVAENLLTERDPMRLRFTTYPEGEHGLIVPNTRTGKPFAQEATLAPLSNGRLLAVMRTDTGFIYCATSGDYGERRGPSPICAFRAAPGGPPMHQPVCPIHLSKLRDGRFVASVPQNNDGTANGGAGPYATLKESYPAVACGCSGGRVGRGSALSDISGAAGRNRKRCYAEG